MTQLTDINQHFEVPFNYVVYFTRKVFENKLLREIIGNNQARIAVILDSGVHDHWPRLPQQVQQYFGKHVCLEVVNVGEQVKNSFSEVERVLEIINKQGIDRHSYVIGIGGGAVLDMVGFACAIAHRGVRHIRIPTTVLSQNDSGVGVKNGVNYFGKKNFIGTFAPPYAVINDAEFLSTLEIRDWRSGIAEAIKVALLKDADFFQWIERNAESLNRRDLDTMEYLVYKCAELHVKHISGNGDPFEFGSSRPLDFGHWSAHKLEHLTNYEVRHGEAVAMGMALDIAYGHNLGFLPESKRDRIIDLIRKCGFAISHELFGSDTINPGLFDGIREFREHLGGELTLTMIEDIGKAIDVHEVDKNQLDKAVKYLSEINAS